MSKIDPQKPLYPIGVLAEMLGIPHRILRGYEEEGVINPSRTYSNRRLYSQNDIQKIEYIHYLRQAKKVNLAGIKVIFNLLDKLKEEERVKLMAEFEDEMKRMSESPDAFPEADVGKPDRNEGE